MTTEQDPDPDATVRMPRPAPKKEELQDFDPDSTLIREDWGKVTILPPPNAIPSEHEPPATPQPPLQPPWDRTLRRPAHKTEHEHR